MGLRMAIRTELEASVLKNGSCKVTYLCGCGFIVVHLDEVEGVWVR